MQRVSGAEETTSTESFNNREECLLFMLTAVAFYSKTPSSPHHRSPSPSPNPTYIAYFLFSHATTSLPMRRET